MAWALTPVETRLRTDINTIAPKRDKASDGTIGDVAHQLTSSGHNPDDTPGVKAEASDADTKQEVRAFDCDTDLRQPGLTMFMIVQAILGNARDRNRFLYIIFNQVIYSKRFNFEAREYLGNNPHTQHAHFSNDPAYDEDNAPFQSVLALGDTMSFLDEQNHAEVMAYRVAALAEGTLNVTGGPTEGAAVWPNLALRQGLNKMDTILANLTTLIGKDFVDEEQIANAVLEGLGTKEVEAIRDALYAAMDEEKIAALKAIL